MRRMLDYIEKYGSIDGWRAMRDLKIMRLASRVHDARELGFPIVGIWRERTAEDGTKTRWKAYYLKKGE